MKIFVTAKPNSREPFVKKIDEIHFIVAVNEPPVDGRANRAISRALAEYFEVGLQNINLVSGFSSKLKVFEIK